MPGPKTHDIFYKQLKPLINKSVFDMLPHYDDYSVFAQGHDLLIYYDFYKIFSTKRLESNLQYSDKLQEFYFPEFVYNYMKYTQESNNNQNEQVRLFLYGYIGHHILDAYTHPLIIYFSGDHMRDKHNSTWRHGIMENLLDVHLMKAAENKNPRNYPTHKDFSIDEKNLSPELKAVLDASLRETYGFQNSGEIFCKAMRQIKLFVRIFKYDPTGAKRVVFDILDPFLKGTAAFSYNRNDTDVQLLLNDRHEIWKNPMNGVTSNKSFTELYEDALKVTADIINNLDYVWRCGTVEWEFIKSIIPNIASTHGLECGQRLEINYKK